MKIHHIGFVVKNIATSYKHYANIFRLIKTSEPIIDSIQKVKILFLENPKEDIKYELVEPLNDSSPVYKAVKKGYSLNHICYEVESIEKRIRQLQNEGNLLISGPISAVAFDGRKIAFLYAKAHLIIELLNRGK